MNQKAVEPALVAIAKITSNDSVPMVYLSKEVRKRTGLERGMRVKLSVDRTRRLIIERLE